MSEAKILIVEDDEELQTLYRLYLQGESFYIEKALNGKQALEALSREKPDVIVLDMIMPEMDGETFLNEIQHRGQWNSIPVIIASVNDKIPKKLLKMPNVFATLKKPFSIETLVDKVREAIAGKSSGPA